MSAQAPNAAAPNAGKKAVHVKWAGKTIALGTFPASEADEKCAKAKALTRAWRSTMRPKPTREWVMQELETLGVRVVSGRLGRKAGEEGDDEDEVKKPGSGDDSGAAGGGTASAMAGLVGDLPAERRGSAGWGTDADLNRLMARRNSSLGLGMMNERRGSLGSLGGLMGLDSAEFGLPLGMGIGLAGFGVGADFNQKGSDQQRRSSSLGLGSLTGGGLGSMGMSVNPNQHYEMLKLHHMNLLNEIQETTLMMNLYQQQQLQQQQQKLQQQASAEGLSTGDSQMLQQGFAQPRNSLGLGGSQLDFASQQMLMQHQMQSGGLGGPADPSGQTMSGGNQAMTKNESTAAGAAKGETKKRAPKGAGAGKAKSKAKKHKTEEPPAHDAKPTTTNV